MGRPSINTIEQLRRVFVLTTPSVCPLLFPLAMIVVVAFAANSPDCTRASSPPAGPKANSVTQSVTGRVIGPGAGLPVAGAQVYLLRRTTECVLLPTHPQMVRADADGRFTFRQVLLGTYVLWAESGNRVSHLTKLGGERVSVTAAGAPTPLTLRLTEACRFRVTVRAKADGRPIAKAAIRFQGPDIERRFETDASGVAIVEGVRPQEEIFEARADGYAIGTATVAATQPGTTNDVGILVAPGGQIRGTVRDAEGRPMAGVGVDARPAERYASRSLTYSKTDHEGRFVLDNVPLDESLEISAERENRWKQKTVLLRPDKKTATVDLSFDKQPDTGSIVVHVTGPDLKPIAGARLSNPSMSTQWTRSGTTDAHGDCRLDHVYDDDRRFRLLVRAKGFVPRQIDFKPGTAASPARVNVALQTGHMLRGRVLLSDGKPARNVAVLFGGGEGIWSPGASAMTDAEGRFLFDSLPPTCVVSVSGPRGYADFESERLSLEETAEVNITLEKAALIKGRVVDDASGKPAIPFRIRMMASTNRQRHEPWPTLEVRLGEEGQLIFQPQGRFEFADLPPGAPLHLVVSAKGYADESLERVLALPDGQFKPLEIRLRKLDPRDLRTVSGKLLSAAGKPVAGADVRLWTATSKPADLTRYPYNWTTIEDGYLAQTADCRQFLAGVTGKDGAFVFPDVPVAGYGELAYWGKGIAAGRETIPLTKDSGPSVPLTLHAAASARIVVEVDRKAWPDAGQIQIHGEKTGLFGDRSNHLAGDPPRLAFNDLPACRVRVQLCDGGQSFGRGTQFRVLSSQTVTLKAGETTTVRFDRP